MRYFGLFAKFWQPGSVMTRLTSCCDASTAANLYRAFLETLLQRLRSCADERVIVITPRGQCQAFAQLVAGLKLDSVWKTEPQSDGDLGDRLRHFFQGAFCKGSRRVVAIGSDSPSLPIEFIAEAFRRLEETDVVIGPAADGGYYLIGANSPLPPIFDHIPWSSSGVYRATVERLHDAGCHYLELPEWYDVDTADDLARLDRELQTSSSLDQHLSRLAVLVREVCRKTAARTEQQQRSGWGPSERQ